MKNLILMFGLCFINVLCFSQNNIVLDFKYNEYCYYSVLDDTIYIQNDCYRKNGFFRFDTPFINQDGSNYLIESFSDIDYDHLSLHVIGNVGKHYVFIVIRDKRIKYILKYELDDDFKPISMIRYSLSESGIYIKEE